MVGRETVPFLTTRRTGGGRHYAYFSAALGGKTLEFVCAPLSSISLQDGPTIYAPIQLKNVLAKRHEEPVPTSVYAVLKLFSDRKAWDTRAMKSYKVRFCDLPSHITISELKERAARSYIGSKSYVDTGFRALDIYIDILIQMELPNYLHKFLVLVKGKVLEVSRLYKKEQVFVILLTVFSELTAIVRHRGNESTGSVGRMWTLFSDFETLLGKVSYKDASIIEEQITPWLTSDPIPRTPDFYSTYFMTAVEFMHRTFVPVVLHSAPPLTFLEYCGRPELWGTTGSGYVGYNTRSFNKWSIYGSYSAEEIYRLALYGENPPLKPLEKPELTKVRAVISASFQSYIMMAYLEYIMADTIVDKAFTTTLMNSRQLEHLERRMMTMNGGVRVPVDQSNFDRQPDLVQIGVWQQLLFHLASASAPHRTRESVSLVVSRLVGTTTFPNLKVRMSDGERRVLHGLPSGWKWTALLGALINVTQLLTMAKLSNTLASVRSAVVQGDDIALIMADRDQAAQLVNTYAHQGFEVNPKKFWISPDRDEFLRRVATPGIVAGYPARMMVKLMYQLTEPEEPSYYISRMPKLTKIPGVLKEFTCPRPDVPWSEVTEELDWREALAILRHRPARTSELATQWLQFIGRFTAACPDKGALTRLYHWFIRDVSHATKIKKRNLVVLLQQPGFWGGYSQSLVGLLRTTSLVDNIVNELDVGLPGPGVTSVRFGTSATSMTPHYLTLIVPSSVQVQSQKELDLWGLCRSSTYAKHYSNIFKRYKLTLPTLTLWAQRLGDKHVVSAINSTMPGSCTPIYDPHTRLFMSNGVSVGMFKRVRVRHVTHRVLRRETPKCIPVIVGLYREQALSIPESVRLSEPDKILSSLQRASGYSLNLIKKILQISRKPVDHPVDARFSQAYSNNWSDLARTAGTFLLTVPLRRFQETMLALSLSVWASTIAAGFTQFLGQGNLSFA